MESTGAVPLKEVSQGSRTAMPSTMEAIKELIHKASFCEKVADVITTEVGNLQHISVRVKILPLVSWEEYCSMQGHCAADSSFLSLSA